jgi:crotonobetainyl-CoA:carnitine CoA-transferase CaiB-like acyl-CoA transferase
VHVPCGPINTLDRVFANPQIQHRGMCQNVPHPKSGALRLLKSPINYSATPVDAPRAPPLHGEQTKEVLQDLLALDADALNALAAASVI